MGSKESKDSKPVNIKKGDSATSDKKEAGDIRKFLVPPHASIQEQYNMGLKRVNADAMTHAKKRNLPFVYHPYGITDNTGRQIRRMMGKWNAKTDTWDLELGMGSCHLLPGEIYTNFSNTRRPTLQFSTLSIYSSPARLFPEWAKEVQMGDLFLGSDGLVIMTTSIECHGSSEFSTLSFDE